MATTSSPEILAIIPARGGSKGVSRKNLRPLGGRPLIAHTIEHAAKTPQVKRVIVSTEDGEIADVARAAGAEVAHRPTELATDTASSESVLRHVLDHLARDEGYVPELVAFLQCTSPLRASNALENAIEMIIRESADSLVSVSPSHRFLWEIDVEGRPAAVNYDYRSRPRRQDMRPQFAENGSIYIFRPWVLLELNNRLGGKICLHVMDDLAALDIDTEADFAVAEAMLSKGAHRAG